MTRIIHISDLHFHGDHAKNRGALRLLDAIHGRYFVDPVTRDETYLMVTGDIVDDSEESQYLTAEAALQRFGGRLLLAMGNHDCCVLGNFYRPLSLPLFDKLYQLSVPHSRDSSISGSEKTPVTCVLTDGDSDVVTIGVNSSLHTESPLDCACGEIGRQQLEALRQLLAPTQMLATHVLVYLHHRPYPFRWPVSETMELKDAAAFRTLVEGRANVVAFGHSGENGAETHGSGTVNMGIGGITRYLDANSSVARQAYFEIVFRRGSEPEISLRAA